MYKWKHLAMLLMTTTSEFHFSMELYGEFIFFLPTRVNNKVLNTKTDIEKNLVLSVPWPGRKIHAAIARRLGGGK